MTDAEKLALRGTVNILTGAAVPTLMMWSRLSRSDVVIVAVGTVLLVILGALLDVRQPWGKP